MTTRAQRHRLSYAPVSIPSNKIEYAFYFAMFYSLTAEIWGISVPMVAGMLFLIISSYCMFQLRSFAKALYAPIGWLIACGMAFVLVQVAVHDVSILDSNLRTYIIWMLQLTLVFSLGLRRGFYFRFPLVLFVLAVTTLPFLSFNPGEVERARVDVDLGIQGGLSHPGGLGEWFGFFAVYFVIVGIESKRFRYRVAAWAAALVCLFVVTLTVGRGPLFAAALAITIAFRGLLRRGFVPTFAMIILAGVVYESGLFEQAVTRYETRASEETGREILWPMAVERLLESGITPLVGVGESRVGMYALSARQASGPHNTFLYLALASGIVPLAFFTGFWIKAAWQSTTNLRGQEYDSFRLPYLVFTFVEVMLGDSALMSPWALVTLSVAAGSTLFYAKERLLVVRVGNKTRFGLLPAHEAREVISTTSHSHSNLSSTAPMRSSSK